MKLRLLVWTVFIVMGVLIVLPAQAQSNTCPALVTQALSEIGTNCANMSRNSACYGYNSVLADFTQSVPDNFFSTPSDRAELAIMDGIQTAPLDEDAGTWGIATLNVQANLPGSLPGQNVVFILLGAVALENDVAPEDTLILPDEPLEVMTASATPLWRTPSAQAEVVGAVEAGTALLADGITPDGEWLRVFFRANRLAAAWVNMSNLESGIDVSALPVISPSSRTPLQAFRFQTSFGGVECAEAPSVLVVQGPDNIEVDITANGADIRIGSTIILRTLPDGSMQIFVIYGGATLNPNSNTPLFVPPGFTSICPADQVSAGNCNWSVPRPITPEEQVELDAVQPLFDNAGNLLHYVPAIPEIICASGVGGVICELRFDDPLEALARASELCALAQLPDNVCSVLFPG